MPKQSFRNLLGNKTNVVIARFCNCAEIVSPQISFLGPGKLKNYVVPALGE
jgi:hypothetical protein